MLINSVFEKLFLPARRPVGGLPCMIRVAALFRACRAQFDTHARTGQRRVLHDSHFRAKRQITRQVGFSVFNRVNQAVARSQRSKPNSNPCPDSRLHLGFRVNSASAWFLVLSSSMCASRLHACTKSSPKLAFAEARFSQKLAFRPGQEIARAPPTQLARTSAGRRRLPAAPPQK